MTKFNYDEVRAANKKKLAEKREAALRLYADKKAPPIDPESVVDGTVIEGKTVAEWDALVTTVYEDKSINDVASIFPGWSLWAVRAWRKNGKPTPNSVLLDKIKKATEEAEKHVALAGNHSTRAASFDVAGNTKKAAQQRKYAETENKKADFWWQEVETLRGQLKGTL